MVYKIVFSAMISIVLFFLSGPVYSHSPDKFERFLQTQQSSGALQLASAIEPEKSAALPTAVVWYLEMAEQGDKDAQYNLGSIYETGFGVNVDMKEAVKWYNKAALQGHQISQLKLGMMYYLGKGAEQSTIKGNKWIREAAKSGNALALLLQENVIAHDVEKDVNPQKLISKTLQAFEKGQINAEETLRLELQKIERARKNAEEKPRFAGTVTGSAAKEGTVKNEVPDFLTKNPRTLGSAEDSLASIRRHAKEGDPKAEYELGRMYETGNQVDENLEEAFRWYKASAAQDYPDAQYRLGLAYLYGAGTPQSTAQAGIWLKKAKDKLHPVATLLLNSISSKRNGVIDKPHSILLSWYLERSVEGDGEAMLGLGYMFENGWGTTKDIEVAKRWYAKARAAGTKGAAMRIRQMKVSAFGSDASTNPSFSDTGAATESRAPTASMPSVKTPAAQKEPGANNMGDSMLDRVKTYLTPVSLLVFGVIMGLLVFRWMRKVNNPRDSVF